MRAVSRFLVLLAGASLAVWSAVPNDTACAARSGVRHAETASAQNVRRNVYQNQPEMTGEEISRFAAIIPEFRTWSRASGELASPAVIQGKADFQYSDKAAAWIRAKGWDPLRFFCVMGRTAAGMTIVSEGASIATQHNDMPAVTAKECDRIREHMSELLQAGSSAPVPQEKAR